MNSQISTSLAEIQRLPIGTRRKLVGLLAAFGPPAAWKDDAIFFDWLAEHYRTCGADHVDAALRSMGGNNARRTLLQCTIGWANEKGIELDPDLDLSQQLDELDQYCPNVSSLVDVLSLLAGGVQQVQDDRQDDPARADTIYLDAEAIFVEMEATLKRIDPSDVPDDLLKLVKTFVSELSNRINELEEARARDDERSKHAAAIAVLRETVSASPPEYGLALPEYLDGIRLEEIEAAIDVVHRLTGAAQAEADATREVQNGRSLDDRKKALEASMRAVEQLESALTDARENLAILTSGGGAAEPDTVADDRDAEPTENPAAPAEEPNEDSVIRPAATEQNVAAIGLTDNLPNGIDDGQSISLPEEPGGETGGLNAGGTAPVVAVDEPSVEVVDDSGASEAAMISHETERGGAPEPMREWDRWVHLALKEDRLGLAVHLARARELAGADRDESWPSVLLEGLITGMSVEAGNDRSAGRYEMLAPQLIEVASSLEVSSSRSFAWALCIISGALRPSLVANYPGINVIDALATGRELTEFHDLLALLRDGPRLGLDAISELTPLAEESELNAQRQLALDNLRDWYGSVQSRTMAYQPATALWQRLIRTDGAIGSVFEATIGGRQGAAGLVQSLVEELRSDLDDFLDSHFAEHMKGKGKELEGTARARFLALLNEARDHLDSWLRVSGPVRSGQDRFEKFRAQLRSALKRAITATADLIATGSANVRMGAAMLRGVLEPFEKQINGMALALPDPRHRLDTEIALLPEFPLNGRIGFEVTVDDVVAMQSAATAALQERVPNWTEAFYRALEGNAPGTAMRIRPLLPEPPRNEVMPLIDAVVIKQRQTLERRRRELRAQLDDYLSATIGDAATEFEALLQGLESFALDTLPCDGQDEAGAIGDFPILAERLEQFGHRLNGSRAAVTDELRARIESIEASNGAELADCRALLERGNLGTLAEELTQIERFGPDRLPADPAHLIAPITRFSSAIIAQSSEAPELQLQSLRDGLARGEARGEFRFDQLPGSERAEARDLLDQWAVLKRTVQGEASARKQALLAFLGALGFSNAKVGNEARWREGKRFDIKVDPLRSAGDCIIPAFGSQAEGAYTVLLMPKGSLEKSLPSGFNELQPPVIVLAMEWLTPKARREFLRKSRGRPGAAFALLDEPTVVSLAATPERNLRSFFSLAVPFGSARPYSDNSAATSLEMFFGRDREYDSLVDPQGSCMVYGGRQLGKTALLKQIELRNMKNPDFIVIYRDIKNVGSVDLPSAVWDRIGEALREKQVATAETCRGDRVIETIKSWLRAQPKRRLLILLDEADNFLESEMESEFPNIVKMKGLMEETGRRTKFVYAGLHNVQRFVRAPNSPILHLGEPVNIGPLLGDDRHAARQMVFEPMAAVGVGFQEPTDAHHMLSLVGYYPSLLQTFGKSLLFKVDQDLARKGELDQIPVLLDREAIEQGFKAAEFRNELREKFRATLELDPRYELIAYAVCYKAEEERARGQIAGHGYSNRDIFELAQQYWPQGFKDIRSSDNFGAILDEMVGLGVLSRHGEGYAIRSARIAAMLGDFDQIMTHLLEFSDRPRPTKPDPLSNHRQLTNGGYSPISWRTEKALIDQLRAEKHPVSLVFLAGSAAVGDAEDIVIGLKSLAEMQEWPQVRELEFRNVEELNRVIVASRRDALPGKPKLIVCQGRWPSIDEVVALDGCKELRDQAHPVRIAFLGTAEDQAFGRGSASVCRTLKTKFIDLVPWDKEAVHLWLLRHARHCADDPAFVAQVLDATGGFAVTFDQVKLPKGPAPNAEDVLIRLTGVADEILDKAVIGIDQPRLSILVERLYEFDHDTGLTEEDIIHIAEDIDRSREAFDALRHMGLVVQVQAKGEPHWRLLSKVGAIIARTQ